LPNPQLPANQQQQPQSDLGEWQRIRHYFHARLEELVGVHLQGKKESATPNGARVQSMVSLAYRVLKIPQAAAGQSRSQRGEN